ncbi:Cyclin [Parasponia andersonii]|uniref:Cyclin n=1 Tax=Parasponia andersonii TaxID=3476 RepID=A0A2P5DSY0_PARAD|nr:Cyclin [Parasponia andersonii]
METRALDGILGISETTYRALGLEESGETTSSGSPQVLPAIASHLEKSIRRNERLVKASRKNDVVSIFHGSKAPTLSVRQYLERIFKYSNCSTSCFVVAYIYVDRFFQNRSGFCLTSLNVHRLLITAVMVAAKFLDDACDNNAYYAQVGGVSTEEMNELEMEFLFSLKFRLQVTTYVFETYCQYLEKGGGSNRDEYPICGRSKVKNF